MIYRLNWQLPCLAGLATLLSVGATLTWIARIPPKEFYQQLACPPTLSAKTQGIQVLSTHFWGGGAVVLYQAQCRLPEVKVGSERVVGYQLLAREGWRWRVSSQGGYRVQPSGQLAKQLVEFGISQGKKGREPLTILYGQVLSPKVAAIAATFDNGRVLREEIHQGTFVLVGIGATRLCELRILGMDHQILRQEELHGPSYPNQLKQLIRTGMPSTICWPRSRQL